MISEAINSNKKTSVIPFITCGYPNVENFVDLLLSLENSGSTVIEIGMPNSDPLAEGLTIQYSSTISLNNGILKIALKEYQIINSIKIEGEKANKIKITP